MKRSSPASWVLVGGSAVAIGVIASLTDDIPFEWHRQHREFLIGAVRLLNILANSAPVWVAIAVIAGAVSSTRAWAATFGCASLVAMAIAYYAYGLTLGDRNTLGVTAILPTATRWLLVAVVIGIIGGLAGHLLHSRWRAGVLLGLGVMCVGYAIYLPFGLTDLPMTLVQVGYVAAAAAFGVAAWISHQAPRREVRAAPGR